jgi:recombination protein RecA
MKSVEDVILKEFGKGALSHGQSILDAENKIIPVSPALDLILGGGIPEGSFVVFTGPPKVGKTSSALDFAATAQQLEYACDIGRKEGRHVYYSSVEGRLKKRDLEGIKHLDLDPKNFTIIKSFPGHILSGEQFIDINERLINDKPGDIFIIDSFSALCTAGEMKAEIGDRYRADAPLLLARFCRRISNVIPVNKSIVIGITHIISDQSRSMAQWSEASGQKLKYQSDVKLRATHFKAWNSGEVQIGQEIHWNCETAALNTPPGGKCVSKFRYGYGLDKAAELIVMAVDLGLVTKGGAWYKFPDGQRGQGIDKSAELLRNDSKLYDDLNGKIREMLGL